MTELQVVESIENLESLEIVVWQPDTRRATARRAFIAALEAERPSWAKTDFSPLEPSRQHVQPTVALLSLFDGTGLARLARLANAAYVPVTQRDWLEWLDTNDVFFRQCLREAPVSS